MHYFYTPDLTSDKYLLPEEESKHCIRVLRLQEGDQIILLNGKGGYFEARIRIPNPKACEVEIIKKDIDSKRSFNLHIAIAPTKLNERFEWFLEKATEIGIDEITPIICARSERKEIKAERMEKVIVAAAKQSIKTWFPVLNPVKTLESFLKGNAGADKKIICHCLSNELPHLKSLYKKNESTAILIGPEGDFSEAEIKQALQHGFTPASLGKSRLRTETAGLIACHTINLLNE